MLKSELTDWNNKTGSSKHSRKGQTEIPRCDCATAVHKCVCYFFPSGKIIIQSSIYQRLSSVILTIVSLDMWESVWRVESGECDTWLKSNTKDCRVQFSPVYPLPPPPLLNTCHSSEEQLGQSLCQPALSTSHQTPNCHHKRDQTGHRGGVTVMCHIVTL